MSEEMPLTLDLANRIVQRAEEGRFSAATTDDLRNVLRPTFGGDVERWLTYLMGSSPYLAEHERLRNRATAHELVGAVAEIIRNCEERAWEGDIPEWVEPLSHYWHESGARIVTLNYDTIVERALQQYRPPQTPFSFPRLYCYPIPSLGARAGGGMFGPEKECSVKVAKLHGSTNWHQEDSPARHGGAPTYLSGAAGRLSDIEAFCASGTVPLLLPPAFTKSDFYEQPIIRTQWMFARDELQYADRVIIVGSSLRPADWDLRNLLVVGCVGPAGGAESYASIKEKEIVVVDQSRQPADEATLLLGGLKVEFLDSVEEMAGRLILPTS